ncbi:unnamed protein product [Diatraea saccharalis]|uniref:Ig-like domain-containing protein n=1 Tax=Diatraea saccharalis TaxID=40085 RepID=A0A9N9WBU2_9NEOP|nr:unnamed protein product [Diatraea saccharalis]
MSAGTDSLKEKEKHRIIQLLISLMVKSTTVDLTHEWKQNFGWEITCSWKLLADDSLQSVKLYKNGNQFIIFRPENQRSMNHSWYSETVSKLDCAEDDNGVTGKCVMTYEPQLAPRKDFTFGCEVSGERPYFRTDQKEIFVEYLIPPSDTEITVTKFESGTVSVNCSASGLPAPKIMWTINNQRFFKPIIFLKVPANYLGPPVWNATSKLWQVWSSFNPQPEDLYSLQCTPEIQKGKQVIRGQSAMYSNAPDRLRITIVPLSLFRGYHYKYGDSQNENIKNDFAVTLGCYKFDVKLIMTCRYNTELG